jgi:2,5-diketo-D-gluconate reductase A
MDSEEIPMQKIPKITLNNGNEMPQLGFGTWRMSDEEAVTAVNAAIESGYRLIDTAALYGNEPGIGEAINQSGVARGELFITTKVWNSDQGHDNTLKAFDKSLVRLGLDYVDLYLIHWPVPAADKYVDTWKALEEIYESGRAKNIGVCNFNIEHLEKLLATAKVVPAVNQVECHPHLPQKELREYCKAKGIQIEAWRPIGGPKGDLMNDATTTNIADKHGRTAAQILIRWSIQLGMIPIPKSVRVERMKENANVFDFELDNDDMAKISALDTGERYGPDPATMNGN